MDVLVCVKRVPATGSEVPLTEDGREVDTRHLGFTIGPHEECAVEEAVRLVERHGGSVTVLTVGPPESAEQLRYALSLGADHAVLVETTDPDPDPQATATAITEAIATLSTPDLVIFGNESADAGNYQVAIRVAHALSLPIVSAVKAITIDPATNQARFQRDTPTGNETYEVDLPSAVAVKEGLNLPRYPSIKGRLRAKKTPIRTVNPELAPGGLRKLRFHSPPEATRETVILGRGPEAAPHVADLLTDLGLTILT